MKPVSASRLTPWLVGVLAAQRLAELRYARHNEKQARAAGAREYGAEHYPLIVALHAGWLASLLLEGRRSGGKVNTPSLLAGLALQGLRYKVIHDLGPYWNTRILIWPGGKRVQRGSYRLLRHPNYLIVIAELFLLPLIVGARRTSLVGGSLNLLLLLGVRIPAEERALEQYGE